MPTWPVPSNGQTNKSSDRVRRPAPARANVRRIQPAFSLHLNCRSCFSVRSAFDSYVPGRAINIDATGRTVRLFSREKDASRRARDIRILHLGLNKQRVFNGRDYLKRIALPVYGVLVAFVNVWDG